MMIEHGVYVIKEEGILRSKTPDERSTWQKEKREEKKTIKAQRHHINDDEEDDDDGGGSEKGIW